LFEKDWLYKIIILALFLLILFLQFCDRTIKPIETEIIIEHTIDSVLIPGTIDTIWYPDSIPYVVKVKEYIYLEKTDSSTGNISKIYENPVEDSLISGSIITEINDSCEITNQTLSYTPKFPQYILRTDTIKIREETTILTHKLKIFAGLEIGGSQEQFNFGPKISLLSRKDLLYSYNYDLINNTHNISFAYKISNPFK
jgi:hypothetical protein